MTDAPERPDSGDRPRVGVDEWVARHEERRERATGLRGRAEEWWDRTPVVARFGVFVIVGVRVM